MRTRSLAALLTASLAIASASMAQDAQPQVSALSQTQPDNVDIEPGLGIELTSELVNAIRSAVAATGLAPVEVGFDLAVGASIPAEVTLSPLPLEIMQLLPGLEGYLFFIANRRIVIVSPATLKIVLVLYA